MWAIHRDSKNSSCVEGKVTTLQFVSYSFLLLSSQEQWSYERHKIRLLAHVCSQTSTAVCCRAAPGWMLMAQPACLSCSHMQHSSPQKTDDWISFRAIINAWAFHLEGRGEFALAQQARDSCKSIPSMWGEHVCSHFSSASAQGQHSQGNCEEARWPLLV